MNIRGIVSGALVRTFDFLLAAALLIAAALPFALLAGFGRLTAQTLRGRGGIPFRALRWEPGRGAMAALAARLGMPAWPLLLAILRGDLSWCGPRALLAGEEAPVDAAAWRDAVRPGIFSLWGLRSRTGIAYGDEWGTDLEQVARTGLPAHLGLLVRSLLAAGYGQAAVPARGRTLVDTLRVDSLRMDEALDVISAHAVAGEKTVQVAFVNPDCVNIARRDSGYRSILNAAALVLADGIGMRIAGRLLGRPFPENVNGTDLFPRLCERLAARGSRLYLLGARPGIAAAVAAWATRTYPGLQVVGSRDGYFADAESAGVAAAIRDSRADVLLLAMGAPRQEAWIAAHAGATGAGVAIGVGGLFDFYGGRIPRAPQWLRELGFEWSWRLLQEPARMWRRYLIGNVSFLAAVVLQRLLGSADLLPVAVAEPAAPADAPQRAVVMALSAVADPAMRSGGVVPALLPLGDRTLLERCLETLAATGCRSADILADACIAELRAIAADAGRWGLALNVHAVAGPAAASERCAAIAVEGEGDFWFVRADTWLPAHALPALPANAMVLDSDADEPVWTGWARIAAAELTTGAAALFGAGSVRSDGQQLRALHSRSPAYSFATTAAALSAQARWLNRTDDVLEPLPARAGVRVAAGAFVEPSATLIAPVEIHAGAVIAAGAIVGPNVVVGRGAMVARGATLKNALLAADTFLAEESELADGLLLAEGLLSSRWNSWLPTRLTASFAGSLACKHRVLATERVFSLCLATLLALPAGMLALAGRRSPLVSTVSALLASAAGRRPLVGITPREFWPDTVVAAGWQPVLAVQPPGVFSPSALPEVLPLGVEVAAWADIHWLLAPSWRSRLRIVGRSCAALFLAEPTSSTRTQLAEAA
jgi:N-acetylglucosaminyldiphosphoundecaprenol N-acetyl-beta-D-mannosaminyltransferase